MILGSIRKGARAGLAAAMATAPGRPSVFLLTLAAPRTTFSSSSFLALLLAGVAAAAGVFLASFAGAGGVKAPFLAGATFSGTLAAAVALDSGFLVAGTAAALAAGLAAALVSGLAMVFVAGLAVVLAAGLAAGLAGALLLFVTFAAFLTATGLAAGRFKFLLEVGLDIGLPFGSRNPLRPGSHFLFLSVSLLGPSIRTAPIKHKLPLLSINR